MDIAGAYAFRPVGKVYFWQREKIRLGPRVYKTEFDGRAILWVDYECP